MRKIVEPREALKSSAEILRDLKETLSLEASRLKAQAHRVGLDAVESTKLTKYVDAMTSVVEAELKVAQLASPKDDLRTILLHRAQVRALPAPTPEGSDDGVE